MRRAGVRTSLAGLVTAVAVGACGGLPTPSGVHVVRRVGAADAADSGPDVTRFPAGPAAGASPQRVVLDFLEAAAGQEDDPAVAREFLADGGTWDSAAGVHVYSSFSTPDPIVSEGGGRVGLRLEQVGFIDRNGSYLPFHQPVELTYELRRTATGDWRIGRAAPGIYLTDTDVSRDYRAGTVYRLARSGDSLVPEPVALRVPREGLASALVRALLRGPGSWLAPATRSGVPAGTSLIDSVTVVGSVATVNLSREARQLNGSAGALFVRQLTATLAGVPGVDRLRLLVEGRAWSAGDPTVSATVASPPAGGLYAVDGSGAVGTVRGSGVVDRSAATGLRAPAVTADGWTAALRGGPGSTRTVLAPPGRPFADAGPVGDLTAPSWLPGGGAAGVVVGVKGSVPAAAFLVRAGRAAVPIPVTGLGTAPLDALRISPDGARVAAVVGTAGARRVLVGRVGSADGHPVLDGWASPGTPPELADVADVTWRNGAALVLTGTASGGNAALAEVSLGEDVPAGIPLTGLPAGPFVVAAAGQEPLVVGAAGALWSEQGAGWHRIGAGHDPVYAR